MALNVKHKMNSFYKTLNATGEKYPDIEVVDVQKPDGAEKPITYVDHHKQDSFFHSVFFAHY